MDNVKGWLVRPKFQDGRTRWDFTESIESAIAAHGCGLDVHPVNGAEDVRLRKDKLFKAEDYLDSDEMILVFLRECVGENDEVLLSCLHSVVVSYIRIHGNPIQ